MSRAIEQMAVVAAARIFLAAHDRVVASDPVTHDDTFAMKNAADNLRDVLREYDLAALLEHLETEPQAGPATPAGVLDEAALRTALDIDWTPFWRETPIEEPDGVHSFMADFDRDAFAAAIAREYAASQPTPGTGLRTAAERLLATIRASHGPVRHYPCDICDRADALAAALGRSGSGGGRG